jgi:hypothetical protein
MTENTERSFGVVLAEVEDGRLVSDLTTAYRKLIKVMTEESNARNAGVTGAITMSLDIALRDGVIEIVPSFSIKEPKQKRSRSIFWADRHGNISRKNPNQQELPLRTVSEEATLRTAVSN